MRFGYFQLPSHFWNSGWMYETNCLVLDIEMPGMTGPELCEELRRRMIKIPIIFITAQAEDRVRRRIESLDSNDCLFKPFTDKALKTAIDAAVSLA